MVNIIQCIGWLFLGIIVWLLMLVVFCIREFAKLFVWARMLAGISFAKIVVLCKMWRVCSRLEDVYDSYYYMPSEAEGVLIEKLNNLRAECEKLNIAKWRQDTAHWLAVY